jgi:hypothetical protein
VYEERELRLHNEKKDKLKSFEKDVDRISKELEFMRTEDKDGMWFCFSNLIHQFHLVFLASKLKAAEIVTKLEKELEKLEKDEKNELKVIFD